MSKKLNEMSETDFLFNPNLLKELDFTETSCMKKNNISPTSAGENLIMRPLNMLDYHKDYVKCMSELTVVGDITSGKFQTRFKEMKACKSTYYVIVIEDTSLNKIAGSGSLIIEKHLNRNVRIVARGRVEDIVVLESHRGRQLGKLLLETLVLLARHVGCDELSLECKDHLVRFYNLFGFEQHKTQNYMTLRYENNNH